MNERIKELAAQAIDHFCDNEKSKIMDEKVLENFAEMIIRECSDMVDNLVTSDDEGNQILDCDDIKTELLEHFGVEQ